MQVKEGFLKLRRFLNVKVVAVVASTAVVATYLSVSGTSTVSKVNGTQTGNAPFVSSGETYVPLNEIANKMGDKVTSVSSQKKVVIQQKNNNTVSVTANQAKAVWNGKLVPLKIKKVNRIYVPVNEKAIYKNGQVYVPLDFLSSNKGLAYPVKVANEGGKRVIYVGKIPAPAKKPVSSQPKSQPAKPSQPSNQPVQTEGQTTTGKKYPDGWVAPVLKSKWSPNSADNFKVLEKELGFTDGGHFYNIKGVSHAIVVNDDTGENEVTFKFYMWDGDAGGVLKEAYRIPIVAKELFKLYFDKDADRVWNYFNKNDIPDTFTANGRTVKAYSIEADGSVYLIVGYPKNR